MPAPVGLATASHGGVEDKGQVGQDGGDPHEDEHLDANVGLDVELALGGQGDLGGHADDGCDDGGHADEDAGNGGDDGDGDGEPAGAHDERGGQHEDKVDDGAGGEEGVHDLRAELEQLQDGSNLGGQGDGGAGEQLAHEDLDGVEPIKGLGLGAKRDALAVVPLTVAPEADLVEVVQAQATGDRVQQARVGDGDGDDLADVELEEVDVVEDGVDVRVAEGDEDEEREGDEVEGHGHEGRVAAGWGDDGGHGGVFFFLSSL